MPDPRETNLPRVVFRVEQLQGLCNARKNRKFANEIDESNRETPLTRARAARYQEAHEYGSLAAHLPETSPPRLLQNRGIPAQHVDNRCVHLHYDDCRRSPATL